MILEGYYSPSACVCHWYCLCVHPGSTNRIQQVQIQTCANTMSRAPPPRELPRIMTANVRSIMAGNSHCQSRQVCLVGPRLITNGTEEFRPSKQIAPSQLKMYEMSICLIVIIFENSHCCLLRGRRWIELVNWVRTAKEIAGYSSAGII
jgi:hypothetical protein